MGSRQVLLQAKAPQCNTRSVLRSSSVQFSPLSTSPRFRVALPLSHFPSSSLTIQVICKSNHGFFTQELAH